MNRILFQGITILPMTRPQDRVERGDILVEGDRISYIGPSKEWEGDFQVFDGEGKVALPGFVNAHTHLAMVFLRGFADDMTLDRWLREKIWPMEARLKAEHVYRFSLLGAAELISSGVTTFADMYFHMDQVARAVEETGLRASLSTGMIAQGNPFPGEVLKRGTNFALTFRGKAGGRITTMLAPHAPYTCPPDFMKKVREIALKENLPVHTHISETRKEVDDCLAEYGLTPPELLDQAGLFDCLVLAAHCVVLEDQDFPILKKLKGVAHCPVSNLKLASGVAPVKKMVDSGVNVALGTDGASSNNRLELLQEIKTASLLAKGVNFDPLALPAFQTLQMATLGGAKALCLEDQIGTLEVGKKADIVVFDFNSPHLQPCFDHYSHLVYSALPSDVHSVMVDGTWLLRERKYQTLDFEEVKEEALKATKEIVEE
ncbi:MAG: amidohydrolase [Caldiserica bacterium]|jgi:5-methylthioadenosine/S-adenosylhomocysteine deaminase|nr:amidohydrolase [Caldisericota bacterium]MDH7562594.1 amidohydrolase [Caldisericota bacterium]